MHYYGAVGVGLMCLVVAINAAQSHPGVETDVDDERMGAASGDCCHDVCSWSPPANCACCGCSSALNACLCCDTPARHGNKGEKCESATWHGFATYDCEVNLANEGYSFCRQECSGWCWATALATVTAFYGGPKTACATAECAQASIRAGFDCCGGRSLNATCADDRCNHGVFWEDFVKLLIKSIPGRTFVSLERSLSASDLLRVLEDRQPVMLGLVKSALDLESQTDFNTADDGHIIVVVGYRAYLLKGGGLDNQFLVSDSLRGALDWFSYDGLRTYSAFKWTKTVYGKT